MFLEDWTAAQLTAAKGLASVPDLLCLMSPIASPSSSGLELSLSSMFLRTEKAPILPHWLPCPH